MLNKMKIHISSDMKFSIPYLGKINLQSKKVKTVKRQTTFQQGFSETTSALNKWNSQPNPLKVYVLGRRVHHGTFYSILGLVGLYVKDPYLVGCGLAGTIDDLPDVDHWFDFEVGGNPNSLITFDQTT